MLTQCNQVRWLETWEVFTVLAVMDMGRELMSEPHYLVTTGDGDMMALFPDEVMCIIDDTPTKYHHDVRFTDCSQGCHAPLTRDRMMLWATTVDMHANQDCDIGGPSFVAWYIAFNRHVKATAKYYID